jgi:acetyl esterase/lipase
VSYDYERDGDDDIGPSFTPIAIGLAFVLVVAAVAWAVVRVGSQTAPPPGVVVVPAHQGTLPASDPPGPTQEIANLAYGPDPVQHLDLYRPPGVKSRLPVLVFLHSGGWLEGDRHDVPSFILREVTRMNVVVASVGYRLAAPGGVDTFPAAIQDVDRAVRWLVANSAFLALDPSRVLVTGTSAGGHLAALEGAAPGAFPDPTLPLQLADVHPHVIGVLDAVGPSDLVSFGKERGLATAMVATFVGCTGTTTVTCDAAKLRAASVAPHLTTSAPPAFLVYGKQDTLVRPSTQGVPLAAAWARARDDVRRSPADRGVWYEEADDGHNVSQTTVNVTELEQWLSRVLAGSLR